MVMGDGEKKLKPNQIFVLTFMSGSDSQKIVAFMGSISLYELVSSM